MITITPLKILIVEDTLISAKMAQIAFQDKGCITVLASSGEEALEKIDDSFHLVLMDLGLPKMDGFDTAREIRKHKCPSIAHIPIYALTAHRSHNNTLNQLQDAGMNGLFIKPLTRETRDILLAKMQ